MLTRSSPANPSYTRDELGEAALFARARVLIPQSIKSTL